ncbi:MAG: SMC-Scp complex subunit ScpB, partial [Candidatus Margulisiibacteriota bacterium]
METVENLGNSDAVEAVESVTLDPARIKSIIESVLFVARKPLSVEQLEEVLELSRDVFQPVLDELLVEYQ